MKLKVDEQQFELVAPKSPGSLAVERAVISDDARRRVFQSLSVDYDGQPVSYRSLRAPFEEVRAQLSALIRERDRWKDVTINTMPITNRLYTDIGKDFRVFLHRLDPSPGKRPAHLHYHQWPSIMHVHENGYRQQLAFGAPKDGTPKIAFETDIVPGTTYEMIDPNVWHAVILDKPSWSTMMVDLSRVQLWGNSVPATSFTSKIKMPNMDAGLRDEMFKKFEQFYP